MPTLAFPCSSTPLTSDDFNNTIAAMNIDAATVWAILNVESGKAGYLPDRRPQILFESAVFHKQTGGAFDATNPNISTPAWDPHSYIGGAGEYTRLAQAYALNPTAALMSASWGLGQLMGFNFQNAGYTSVSDYVSEACASEANQLAQFKSFLEKTGVLAPLQGHDWVAVATHYNSSGQVAKYSANLQNSYTALQAPGKLPDLDVRAAQLYLRFLSLSSNVPAWNPSMIDGQWGPHTQAALNGFQTSQGVATTTGVDAGVLASLVAALPAALPLNLG